MKTVIIKDISCRGSKLFKNEIKFSLYSRYYAKTFNESGPSPKDFVMATQLQKI